MNVIELDAIEASLLNPDDPAEVNIVVDAAGVGITNRLASGQIVKWTAPKLREFAPSMKGMPINIEMDGAGDLRGHSRRVVGAITESTFNEADGVVRATGTIWRHYFPTLLARLKELFAEGKLQTSMEFLPSSELISNSDGTQTPDRGRFSGLALVRKGADPRSRALLLAAADEDEANQEVEVAMNLDQLTEIVARKLGRRTPDPDYEVQLEDGSLEGEVCAECDEIHAAPMSTRSREALPDSSFACPEERKYPVMHKDGSIDLAHLRNAMARVSDPANDQCGKATIVRLAKEHGMGDAMAATDETETPAPEDSVTDMEAPILDPTNEELRSTLRAELQTEFQAQIATLTEERDTALTVNTQREEAARLDTLASIRATELDKILPVTTDAGRTRRLAAVRSLDEAAYEALKAELADAAEVKGGLHSDADANVDSDEGKTPMEIAVAKELAEIRAARSADPSKEKK